MNETYKMKQDWVRAVMASDLSPATKTYAWGIYDHMYGNKTDSFPGAKALVKATGLNDSQFYKYNKALIEAGLIEVTSRKGTSNTYRLLEPTSTEGMYLPSQEVTLPSERVTPTLTEGTNTTSNTSKKSSKEETNETPTVSDEPVVTTSLNNEVKDEQPSLTSYEDVAASPNFKWEDFEAPKTRAEAAPVGVRGRSMYEGRDDTW